MNETLVAQDYRQLVEQFGSPLLLLDKAAVRKQYRALAAALPDVRLHYALKPLPHEAVVSVLKEEGACFDLATNGEVDLVRSQGVRPGRCIHTHPIKRDSDIRYALEFGCTVFVYDNPLELEKFLPYKDEVKLLLRVSFPNPETKVDLSKKFGCTPEQALPLLQLAQAKGIKVMGLSFHVGSQVPHARRHVQAIDACREIMEQAWELGLKPWVLDIGGGFPIPEPKVKFNLPEILRQINARLDEDFADAEIWAEPGRYICGTAVNLVTSVIGTKNRNGKPWYILDEGIYGCFSGIMYDHWTYPLHCFGKGPKIPSMFGGPSCDGIDVLYRDFEAPSLRIGDRLLVTEMGAYTNVSATRFNGFYLAPTVIFENQPEYAARHQETAGEKDTEAVI